MKRYLGYQFRAGVVAFTQKAASALNLKNITVVWEPGITTAGVNSSNTMFLADVADDATLTQRDLLKYCGFVLHELCHVAYTCFKVQGSDQYVRSLHNAVEDAFIEHRAIDKTLVGNVREVFTALINTMVESAMASVSDWSDPRQYPFALAVYLRKHAQTKVPLADGLEPIFNEAAKRLVGAQNSQDTLVIAEWVYAQLQALSKPEKEKPGNKPKGKPENSDAPDGQPNGQPDQAGEARAPAHDCDPAEVEPTIEASGPKKYRSYKPDSLAPIDDHLCGQWQTLSATVPGKLRYNLRRLFDNSDYSDFQHNRKFGTVNAGAIAQYKHSGNVFKLRREIEGIDSAVVICLDVSSSMFSDEPGRLRIKVASQCTAALLDTLKHAQVATSVLTFGREVAVLKGWSDSTTLAKDRLSKIDSGGSTNDYTAIRFAHESLLGRNEARKVCIVITDGDGDCPPDTKQQVQTGSRLGITTIGIGISLDVSRIYPEHINVKNVNDLGEATFRNIRLAA